ncbi:MAG: undecaprenyl-diphosphate phosphatase [Christensenellales bacterium]|jgi:undecaprenyl-diphosphatase
MTIFQAIILGLVQGLTEFLPISSSGHLVLLSKVFGIKSNFVFFSIALHFATLLAVLWHFRKEVWLVVKKPFGPLAVKLYIATIPAIIVALLFNDQIEKMFSGTLLPFCFMFTAVLLILTQICATKQKHKKKIDYKGALFMGFMQAVAIIPGISRSGSTISGSVLAGYDKEESAHFSFLISVPIILASCAYEVLKIFKQGAGLIFPLQTIVSSLFAFLSGIFAIKLMLNIVKKVKFHYFSYYLIILSIISFIIYF